MLDMLSDKDKLWALHHLIRAAEIKSQEIAKINDQNAAARMANVVAVIDDAARKLCGLRWVDKDGIGTGVGVYLTVIDNL